MLYLCMYTYIIIHVCMYACMYVVGVEMIGVDEKEKENGGGWSKKLGADRVRRSQMGYRHFVSLTFYFTDGCENQ